MTKELDPTRIYQELKFVHSGRVVYMFLSHAEDGTEEEVYLGETTLALGPMQQAKLRVQLEGDSLVDAFNAYDATIEEARKEFMEKLKEEQPSIAIPSNVDKSVLGL